MLLVQYALRMLHVTRQGLEDDPCSTDGCEEGPRNGAQRVEVAAIDDPAKQVDGDGSDGCLYKRYFRQEHCRLLLSNGKGVRESTGRERF